MRDRGLPLRKRMRVVRPSAPGPGRSEALNLARRAALPFAVAFAAVALLHLPLLWLPYFWDEAGYYVPAARDLLLTGALIPHSTAANSHPPLVLLSLALGWKLAGFHAVVTRVVMLMWSALALAGLFRLGRRVANTEVAFGTCILCGLYPVFFAQSTLAHLDMAAATLTLWGLLYYIEQRWIPCVIVFSLAALAKETAIITPLALLGWEMVCWITRGNPRMQRLCGRNSRDLTDLFYLLIPAIPLAGWFFYLHTRTGYWLGDPGFAQYNLSGTLSIARFLLAMPQRIWHLAFHMNMYVLLAATILAMFFPALPEDDVLAKRGRVVELPIEPANERKRIAFPTQIVFLIVAVAHIILLSVVGGAVLARYMLPVVPLFILICVSTLRRRVYQWPYVLAIVAAGFCIGLFINPPYRFAPEDNLAYRDYVLLHQDAANMVGQRYGTATVLTAWPASDELTRPYLGYVQSPVRVLRVENFSTEQIEAAAQRNDFDLALVFSTKYEPPHGSPIDWIGPWRRAHEQYFDYHRDLPPDLAAQILHGRIVYQRQRGGQWVALVEVNRVVNARLRR